MRRFVLVVVGLAIGSMAPSVRADDFAIEVKVQAGKNPETLEAKYPRPDAKPMPRGVLMMATDAPVVVTWTVRNAGKETIKDVLVHFFVVKIDKADQREIPKLTKGVVAESALTMDFKAQDKCQGEISFAAPAPGRYLLRLELKNSGGKDEPFADAELLVR